MLSPAATARRDKATVLYKLRLIGAMGNFVSSLVVYSRGFITDCVAICRAASASEGVRVLWERMEVISLVPIVPIPLLTRQDDDR